uniref:Uncharacterized protein n=1 Tax=Oryza brachyantha TaxID=4533 RepID=J3M175_ORYBR
MRQEQGGGQKNTKIRASHSDYSLAAVGVPPLPRFSIPPEWLHQVAVGRQPFLQKLEHCVLSTPTKLLGLLPHRRFAGDVSVVIATNVLQYMFILI